MTSFMKFMTCFLLLDSAIFNFPNKIISTNGGIIYYNDMSLFIVYPGNSNNDIEMSVEMFVVTFLEIP